MAILVDTSSILALASIGELEILHKLFKKITITKEIRSELLVKEEPYKHVISEALRRWISVSKARRSGKSPPVRGLGPGERSLFSIYKEGDLLVIDDALARRTAKVLGYEYTGLLGLLIAGVKSKTISKKKAMKVLEGLASSRFHMSAALFLDVKRTIERY